jgi:hypothetical protein
VADPTAPEPSVPDPRLAILEAQLEREREISRQASAQLSSLARQESRIANGHPRPDPPAPSSGWTIETSMAHLLALREGDRRFYEERDRRYAEVNVEKEKALKIKETADLAALQLAREIQTYKDEKANELREQINSERGLYATKDDLANAIREVSATIKPLAEFISVARGEKAGSGESRSTTHDVTIAREARRANFFSGLALVVAIAVLAVLVIHG